MQGLPRSPGHYQGSPTASVRTAASTYRGAPSAHAQSPGGASSRSMRQPTPVGSSFAAAPAPLDTSAVLTERSALPSASGSKAVLSALRALQDKIRRMEAERTDLLEHVGELKASLAAEHESHRRESQQLHTQSEHSGAASRAELDAAREEKNQLNLHVVRAEEQKKALTRELQHVRESSQASIDEGRIATTRVAALEKRAECLERDLREAVARGKEAAASAVRARAEADEAVEEARGAARSADENAAEESAMRATAEDKQAKTEEMLRSVMEINQALVTKLNEQNAPKKKQRKVKKRAPAAGHIAPTRASTLRAERNAANAQAATRSAAARRGAAPKTKKKRAGGGGGGGGANTHALLAESYGKEIPWVAAGKPGKTHSVIGTVQNGLHQAKHTSPKPGASAPMNYAAEGGEAVPLKRGALDAAAGAEHGGGARAALASSGLFAEQLGVAAQLAGVRFPGSSFSMGASAPAPPPALRMPGAGGAAGAGAGADELPHWGAPISATGEATDDELLQPGERPGDQMLGIGSFGPSAAGARDATAVIESLEEELAEANARYQQLMQAMSSQETDEQLTSTMAELIGEIQRKNQQVYLLKKSARAAHAARERAVVHSPDAFRKKAASLRLLASFREQTSS